MFGVARHGRIEEFRTSCRPFIRLSALLAALALANGCGDGDSPIAPPPDPPRPATVAVNPATAELSALGTTVQLSAEVRDQNGQVMAGAVVAWSSGNASVATVDAAGLVTAIANGTTTVTATSGSASGSATVTVEQSVRAVTVSPAADTLLAVGDTVRLAGEARDANGHAVAGAEFSWASSDTLVAMVDATGLVTAMGNGTATVTATSGSASESATVTVEQQVHGVTVSPAADTLPALGDTLRLTAEARDGNGHVVAGAEFSWASSDTLVAMVDAAGLVTAVANGTATITASSGSASGTATVTVEQGARAVTVSPAADTLLALGDTVRLAAEARDGNGRAVAGAEFSWESSDTLVAMVDATGLVTATANGTATLTATSGSASGSATVTVEQRVRAVTVSPAADTLLALGDTVRLATEARDGNGHLVAGAEFSWESGDTLVAMVDATGLVRAAANGKATVTATSEGLSDSAWIVVEQAVAAVRSWPESIGLQVGDTAHLEAVALDARDNQVPGVEFSWASSDMTVTTVDAAGLIRAVGVGVATVTAAAGDWRGSSRVVVQSNDPADHHAMLIAGLSERPFAGMTVGGNEGSTNTVGTLRLGLHSDVLPVIVRRRAGRLSVLMAGSRLGRGRVVAYSGQDFLSSGDQATLLGKASADRLLANAVRWAGWKTGPEPLRILADNQRIADALGAQGLNGVTVVGTRRRGGHERDWSATALADADVAVVQTNEWGAAHLVDDFVAPLRAFVERGGGLVIAGSAVHWSVWIEHYHGPFTADALLRGTGIAWNEDSIDEIASATTRLDGRALNPAALWETYVGGGRIARDRMALLPGLFAAALELGRTEELDAALVRLVGETPRLPVSSSVAQARLAAEVAETLGAHEWPRPHPWAAVFPGLPARRARRVDGAVTVDATWSEFPADARRDERHLPLGFYAPPGALVTIDVPAGHATGELRVAVGQSHDHLGESYTAQTVWRRAPWLRREFPLLDRQTGVTNAYGGSIALVIPADYTGTIPVTVRGAIPMAVYTAGESNTAEWFAALDAGAPQAVIQQRGGIRLVISAERARGITDPREVSAFWDGFRRRHAELAGGPPRAYESTWIFDPQVGWGYANARRLGINYPLHGEVWVLLPGTSQGRAYIASLRRLGPQPHVRPPSRGYSPSAHGVDWWLFGHELGHQWQTADWTGHGITEVGVNLFTMYTLNHHVYRGGDFNVSTEHSSHPCAAPLNSAALARQRWSTADNCERLALYRQLIGEFGWDAMKAVFHSYYDPAYPRSTYGGSLDGFAIRLSAIVERDLVAFFRRWEYPLSGSASATIRSFGFEGWLPPGW